MIKQLESMPAKPVSRGFFRRVAVLMTAVFMAAALLPAVADTLSLSGLSATLKGELMQGALVFGQTLPGAQLRLNDQPVRLDAAGRFVIGFDRDAALEQTLALTLPDGEVRQQKLRLAARDYRVQRVTGVPERTVHPDPRQLARIRKEAALVSKARDIDSDLEDLFAAFIWPAAGPISGVYGSQRVYNGTPGRPHFGVDVAAPKGDPVIAPAAGLVRLAEADLYFSGGTIIIDHGYGVSSTLMHLDEVLVKTGQPVAQGDLVGRVGASGRATGPHLDWRMNWYHTRVDPVTIAPALVDGHTPP